MNENMFGKTVSEVISLQRCTFGEKIKKMDGEDLISIAFAFKFFESNDLPDKKIPFEELVFLALFGIEVRKLLLLSYLLRYL